MLARMLGSWGLVLMLAAIAAACPFCEATSPTWLQSIREADTAVIAKAVRVLPPGDADPIPISKVKYQIVETLRGADKAPTNHALTMEVLEPPAPGGHSLLTAVGAPDLSWSTLAELTGERGAYLAAARQLPSEGVARWQFFYRYLEHPDEALAADAYGEFAAASFAEVKAFAKHAERRQLWQWIESDKTPESRRGLYYTLLGLCGQPEDADRLAAMIKSPQRRPPGAFSALVACYISLKGEAGLQAIEAQLLKPHSEQQDDLQAAIVALRFHGEEQHVLPRERVARSLRLVLDRPAVAAVVIPDLARWQDWDSMPQLVTLFEEARGDTAWLRIPIIAYLKACPLPAAQTRLDALRKLDPDVVKQAEALALFGAQLGKE